MANICLLTFLILAAAAYASSDNTPSSQGADDEVAMLQVKMQPNLRSNFTEESVDYTLPKGYDAYPGDCFGNDQDVLEHTDAFCCAVACNEQRIKTTDKTKLPGEKTHGCVGFSTIDDSRCVLKARSCEKDEVVTHTGWTFMRYVGGVLGQPNALMLDEVEGFTEGTPDGGGSIVYLDRQNVDCGANSVVHGFKLERHDAKIHYRVTCSPALPLWKGVQFTKSTPFNDEGKGQTFYLDRHTVDCGPNALISQFRLTREAGRIHYEYTCTKVTRGLSCYKSLTTPSDDGKGHLGYLDRQNVDCPEGRALNSFRLIWTDKASVWSGSAKNGETLEMGTVRYEMNCCHIAMCKGAPFYR